MRDPKDVDIFQFILALFLGWTFLALYSWGSTSGFWQGAKVFTTVWVPGSAAYFVGCLAGFIFGLPRSPVRRENGNSVMPLVSTGNTQHENDARARLEDNTALQDISDWLTKIVIGIGIAQFSSIQAEFWQMSKVIGSAMGDRNGSNTNAVIAAAALIYGLVCGFMYYYAWARVRFYSDLTRLYNLQPDPDP